MVNLPRLEARPAPSAAMTLLSPLAALAATVLAGGVLLGLLGQPPLEALRVYFISPFTDAYSRAELAVKAIPLALIGAGLAVSFRANVWNIGAAGQYTLGAICSGAMALYAPEAAEGGGWLLLYLLAGVLGGMLWGAIPAWLATRFRTNEILVSLMLTYVAALLLDWLVRGPWRDPAGFGFPQSADFGAAFIMPVLVEGTRLHFGLVLAVMVALVLGGVMALSLRGFSLRVIGTAPQAAAFAGFSRSGAVWFAFLLSGGLAGLAGAIEVSATVQQLQPDISASYGFVAIIVAFLGRLNPVGALFGAVVLAVSYIGGENAQIELGLPRNATGLFQGLLLFFLLAADTLIRYRVAFGAAPGAEALERARRAAAGEAQEDAPPAGARGGMGS
ncbi:MAG: ABC transporter permease [Pseudomonadota bacterium]